MFHYLPDAEDAILTKLSGELPGVLVATREPATRPTEWVRLYIGGGGDAPVPVHERFTVTVETWHKSRESAAAALANRIRTILAGWGFQRGQTLTSDGVTARIITVAAPRPVSYPPGDGWSRYTATYQFTVSH
ncbi:hypothetical protein VVR12_03320 [Rothia sp. LK2588]|uniref:hypothetical protein n=1 Tax=Rothia sp. LK2588 TaxID=3114369 RepID=UPI0034CEFE1D